MSRETSITLNQPISFGDTQYEIVVLREPHTGDVISAQEESERLVPTPNGYQLVSSPSRVGLNVLRRQITRLTDRNGKQYDGPLAVEEMHRFALEDFNRLHEAADELDAAAQTTQLTERTAARGRGEGEETGD